LNKGDKMEKWNVKTDICQFDLEKELNAFAGLFYKIYSISTFRNLGTLYYTIIAYKEI